MKIEISFKKINYTGDKKITHIIDNCEIVNNEIKIVEGKEISSYNLSQIEKILINKE